MGESGGVRTRQSEGREKLGLSAVGLGDLVGDEFGKPNHESVKHFLVKESGAAGSLSAF